MKLAALLILFAGCSTPSPKPAPELFPPTLHEEALPAHPPLFLKDAELSEVQSAITQDPKLKAWYELLESRSEALIRSPTIHPVPSNEDNLEEVRRSLRIIVTLAGLYRLDHDPRKLQRARTELLAAAHLPKWDNDHFLQTSELSFAVATGYDWLFNFLSRDDRQMIANALIEKGLRAGQARYLKGDAWTKTTSNWNQVCSGSLGVAALAVAETSPQLSDEILDRAYHSIQIAMARYAPDGGYPEGAMYWNYGTKYNVYFIDALKTTFGSDGDLAKADGFSQTARFELAMIDPLGRRANFGDADEPPSPAPEMFWLAREFHKPEYFSQELKVAADQPSIFHLLWAIHQPAPMTESAALDPNQFFRGINVATFRGDWGHKESLFAAFKGGSNLENHAHLDLGAFIFDLQGVRWAIDLGPDDYELPGYFDKKSQRWNYFRLGTLSHSTVILDSENQNLQAAAPIIKFESHPHKSWAVMDITSTYPTKATSIQRGLMTLDNRRLLIQDELNLKAPADVVWNFLTKASARQSVDGMELTQGTAKLRMRILEPPGAHFEIHPATAPLPQGQQPDARMIQLKIAKATGSLRIVVLLEPEGLAADLPKIEDLADW